MDSLDEKRKNAGSGEPSRRKFLAGVLATVVAGVASNAAEASDLSPFYMNPRLEKMPDANMAPGFDREKIVADVEGEVKLLGSIFMLTDPHARADFITQKVDPEFFDANGYPNFQKVEEKHSKDGDKTVMLVAGAYQSSAGPWIGGYALEKGQAVGTDDMAQNNRGLLVIENGAPEIHFLSDFPHPLDLQTFIEDSKAKRKDVYQCSSYIRPGGEFNSSNTSKYKLRFFVELEGKKAVINLTESMTYTDAIKILKELGVSKAVSLDTGALSEGFFYDVEGKPFQMIDSNYAQKGGYTNLLVLYSSWSG